MKKLRKYVALLCCCIFLGTNTLVSFAAENEIPQAVPVDLELPTNTDDSSEYFKFVPSYHRIASDGSFTFSFKNSLESSSFVANSNTLKVSAKATNSSNPGESYYIGVYNTNGSQVGRASYKANGSSQIHSFSVTKGQTYTLHFWKSIFSSGGTITGSGIVSPIK